jgi:hypothetical protein
MVTLGSGLRPSGVGGHAGRPDLAWMLWEVLDSWTISPAGRERARSAGGCIERHRLRVSGPKPGSPAEFADYVLVVSRYADRPADWWMRPE